MMKKNCSLCGMTCYDNKDVCDICKEHFSEVSENPLLKEANVLPKEEIQTNSEQVQKRNTYKNNYGYENSNRTNSNRDDKYSSSLNHNLHSQTNKSPQQTSRLFSVTAKLFTVFLIISIGIVFVWRSYEANYNSKIMKIGDKQTEEIEPWFSNWFRQYPTGEEVIEQFEKVTYAKGNKTVSQTFVLKGKGKILPENSSVLLWAAFLKQKGNKNSEQILPTAIRNESREDFTNRYFSDFNKVNMQFIMYLKNPNKMVMTMTLAAKVDETQTVKINAIVGNDGENEWNTLDNNYTSKTNSPNKNNKSVNFGFGRNSEGISMTFPKNLFEKIELKEEVALLGRKHYKLEVIDIDRIPYFIFFDQETGLATKVKDNEMEMYILDYTLFNDSLIPSKLLIVQNKSNSPPMLLEIDKLEAGTPIDDKVFLKNSQQ